MKLFALFTIVIALAQATIRVDFPKHTDMVKEIRSRLPSDAAELSSRSERQVAPRCTIGVTCPIGDDDFCAAPTSCCPIGGDFTNPGVNGTCFESLDSLTLNQTCTLTMSNSTIEDCFNSCGNAAGGFLDELTCNSQTQRCNYPMTHLCSCQQDSDCGGGSSDFDNRCISGTCDFFRDDGEICDRDAHCSSGNCGASNTCVGIAMGQPCDAGNNRNGNPCATGLWCEPTMPGFDLFDEVVPGTCQSTVPVSGDCGLPELIGGGCGHGFSCNIVVDDIFDCINITGNITFLDCGTCLPIFGGSTGAPCSSSFFCGLDLRCTEANVCGSRANPTCTPNDLGGNFCPIFSDCVCSNNPGNDTICVDNIPSSITNTDAFTVAANSFDAMIECRRTNGCTDYSDPTIEGSCANINCLSEAAQFFCDAGAAGVLELGASEGALCGLDCDSTPARFDTIPPPCCTGLSCQRDLVCECYTDNTCEELSFGAASVLSIPLAASLFLAVLFY